MRSCSVRTIFAAHKDKVMKRFHVHLGVPDLNASIRFYTGLFGMAPSVRKDDYAKWMLDDPRVNFAISHRGRASGLNHLGLQAESADELAAIRSQFEAADASATLAEPNAQCCYAKGDKHWVTDPQGIAWEAFHTLETIPMFGVDEPTLQATAECCSPQPAPPAKSCATKTMSCC
jgi:catechol 2,3-dioxygenase-like lactoylglutathione lyase family enzyme